MSAPACEEAMAMTRRTSASEGSTGITEPGLTCARSRSVVRDRRSTLARGVSASRRRA